jgi:hypothetical protein
MKGGLQTVDEILDACVLVAVQFEVEADPLLHDVSPEKVVNLLQEAGSLSVANFVKHIDRIIGVVYRHRYRVSGLPAIVAKCLGQVMLNSEPWVLNILESMAFLKADTCAVVSETLFKP